DLGDDNAADLPETVAAFADPRLAQDVEPERRLGLPAPLPQPELVVRQRIRPDHARDALAGRKTSAEPSLEVAARERAIGALVDGACDGGRQFDQRPRKRPVDGLCALRRRATGDVEEERPVDTPVAVR